MRFYFRFLQKVKTKKKCEIKNTNQTHPNISIFCTKIDILLKKWFQRERERERLKVSTYFSNIQMHRQELLSNFGRLVPNQVSCSDFFLLTDVEYSSHDRS